MSQHNSKAFKSLEREWYNKLKESGFNDIEDVSTEQRNLKSWHSFRFGYVESAPDTYFYEAKELLCSYQFANEGHKFIWELHCQGKTVRQIAAAIGVYEKSTIHNVIKSIAKSIKKQ